MAILKKLLVLVDGSERSERTVNYVKAFMPVDDAARIVLFHVFMGLPDIYRGFDQDTFLVDAVNELRTWETDQRNRIKTHLEQMKTHLIHGGFREGQIEIKCQPLEKGVARDIINEAKKGYGAVVMSRRGTSMALQSIILGSVAVKLLQAVSFMPIIFVGPAPPVKKILLAVDASESSMKAVEHVAELLGGQGYEVCLIHVIFGLGGVDFEISGFDVPQLAGRAPENRIEAFKLEVARMFQAMKGKLLAAGFAPQNITEKIVSGVHSRSEAIVREAESGGFGTIVVGRRGLSKVEAFFMGRVGHKVVYGGKQFTVWVV